MKKILSILVCACVLLSAMVFSVSAADNSATLSFADKSARTSYSTSQQVWEQNGIKLTNDKGASTSNVGDYANPGRFYKSSTVTIEYPGMTKIVIDSVTYDDNDYAGAWVNSFDTTLGTAVATDGDVTITLNSAVNSITFEKMAAQARAYSITVYADEVTPPAGDDEEIITPPAGDDDDEKEEVVPGFDPTGKTAAEIVDAAYALEAGAAFEKAATLTGVITAVNTEYSEQFKNVTVTITVNGADANKPIKCYRIKGDGADVIAVGDTITVTGIIKNYQHSSGDTEVEFDAGSTLDSYVKAAGGEITPPAGDEEEKEEDKKEDKEEEKEPVLGFGVVANPVAGTAYKFGMVQGNLGKTLFLTGEMDGFYMGTTEDKDAAADVYLEETTGGYYIYAMVNGAKKYLGIVEAVGTDGNTHINAVFTDTADSVFTYNEELKTFVTPVGDKEYGFGTRNDREYTTISPSSAEYTDNFICQFYGMTVVEEGDDDANTDNSTTSPSTGDNAGALVAFAMVAAAALVYTTKKRA